MRKREHELARPYAAATNDTRFAGTFEVLVPSAVLIARTFPSQPDPMELAVRQ